MVSEWSKPYKYPYYSKRTHWMSLVRSQLQIKSEAFTETCLAETFLADKATFTIWSSWLLYHILDGLPTGVADFRRYKNKFRTDRQNDRQHDIQKLAYPLLSPKRGDINGRGHNFKIGTATSVNFRFLKAHLVDTLIWYFDI